MRFLFLIIGIAGFIWFLHIQFPYVLSSSDNRMHLTYSVILLLAMCGSVVARRDKLSETAKHALIWLAIFFVIVLGYSYRDIIMGSRLAAELLPSRPIMRSDGALVIRAGENGHFYIDGNVNGVRVRFMVDTGASDIVLSPDDARRVGYTSDNLEFNRYYHTANGLVKGASVKLDSLEVGPALIKDIPASVNGGEMDGSLLGMTFLQLFKEYRVEGGSLVLTP